MEKKLVATSRKRGKGARGALAGRRSHERAVSDDPWRRGYAAGYKAAQDALVVRFDGDPLTRWRDSSLSAVKSAVWGAVAFVLDATPMVKP